MFFSKKLNDSALQKTAEVVTLVGLWVLIFATIGTPYPFHYDSVNYALAIAEKFDTGIHQPHPPGYLFHILFGRLIYLFVDNPFYVQQLQNIFYLLAVLPCWLMIKGVQKFDLIFLGTFPLILFFPAVPIIFAASFAAGCWMAVALSKMDEGSWSPLIPGFIFAVSIGFRQDMLIMLGPVFLYCLIRGRYRAKIWLKLVAIGFTVTMLWYIPTLILSGGLEPFSHTNAENTKFYLYSSVLFGAPLLENVRVALRFLLYMPATLGPGGICLVLICLKTLPKKNWIPVILALAPIVIYGTVLLLPFSYYYASGLGFFISWVTVKGGLPEKRKYLLLFLAILNISFFCFMPKAQYQPWRGTYKDRTIVENIAKQLLYTGANSRESALHRRDIIDFAQSTIAKSDIFYVEDDILWDRIWCYLSAHSWNNIHTRELEEAELILGWYNPESTKELVARHNNLAVYRLPQQEPQ
ncbi:hypothetical protein QA601_03965 [Chitinispirillales bacterium ANBcel5]|uniref:hypothetical protein n=1 Tax=Cellulosispirillum alkaliphilum TaxID=3039283 RepID=UPI002A551941|nr:hypothetical protein [Chitinispirillales bacterium ANBcel5]